MHSPATYCVSRFESIRRPTREVSIGSLSIGGNHPVRIQSMTTTDTLDVRATARQAIELAQAGCEIVRITAPSVRAAESLGEIGKVVRAAKVDAPLVADVHFLPQAAMEAAKHVEKVRINPGNYADRKKFLVREYSDAQYEEELERLDSAFRPLVLRCRELGRTIRIGTNHGSLSDRIMNRFGDTPRGMAESALEFLRIARAHGFHDLVVSMKSSNPKVMIAAYRLVASMMNGEGMDYPLHLGVTEAGDGEDARIKSAIGIGSLLLDGLGDTLRVSLTEDPIEEIPVARDLARRADAWWRQSENPKSEPIRPESIDPFDYKQRSCIEVSIPPIKLGGKSPPAVLASSSHGLEEVDAIIHELARVQASSKEAPIEGLVVCLREDKDLTRLETLRKFTLGAVAMIVVDDLREDPASHLPASSSLSPPLLWHGSMVGLDEVAAARFLAHCEIAGHHPCLSLPADTLSPGMELLLQSASPSPVIALSPDASEMNSVAGHRSLISALDSSNLNLPLWIRNCAHNRLFLEDHFFSSLILDSSVLSGSLLCDGIGNLLSVEHAGSLNRNRALAYNLLQGARSRISKTEFVACPSCGRTQFDLQSTTRKVKDATGHLKGVTIAIMGCIVNGPGEMADADFGYVGAGPGKIDLYVGKNRVQSAIPQIDAVDRLIELIQEEGKWTEPR